MSVLHDISLAKSRSIEITIGCLLSLFHAATLAQYTSVNLYPSELGEGWRAELIIPKGSREKYDAAVREYILSVESLRVLRGDVNSNRLQAVWEISRAQTIDLSKAAQMIDVVGSDLGRFGHGLVAYHFMKPDGPGDVKRSAPTSYIVGRDRSENDRKDVGNIFAGALAEHVGAERSHFDVAAGLIQLKQDIGYIRRGKPIRKVFEYHWPGFDDPRGILFTTLGQRHVSRTRLERGRSFISGLVSESTPRAPGPRMTSQRQEPIVGGWRDDSIENIPGAGSRTQREDRLPKSRENQRRSDTDLDPRIRIEYQELFPDEPFTMCVERDGC